MILFPNCKINLGLNIIRKREDGYHDLETVFYPIGLKDALEGIKSEINDAGIAFNNSGLLIDGDPANNLCVKAFHLLQKDFPVISSMQVHLHKAIPMGAGLGGGSADGAFMLLLINKSFHLGLSQEQLISYASQLGSDCPFFIINKPCIATGRGEMLKEIELDLSAYNFVIVDPKIHISTSLAFAGIKPTKPAIPISDIIGLSVTQWKGLLVNDFEKTIHNAYPQIASIKQELYNKGAVYASMSGSGSSVFGMFTKGYDPDISFDPSFQVYKL